MRKTLLKEEYKAVGNAVAFTHVVLSTLLVCISSGSYPVLSGSFTQFLSTVFGGFKGVGGLFYTLPTGLIVAKEV